MSAISNTFKIKWLLEKADTRISTSVYCSPTVRILGKTEFGQKIRSNKAAIPGERLVWAPLEQSTSIIYYMASVWTTWYAETGHKCNQKLQ
jgi:hypothetical protein